MRRAFLIALCLALVPPAGCANGHGRTPRGTLTVAVRKEPASLDPLLLEGITSYIFSEFFYAYLTSYDSDAHIVPQLALTVPSLSNGGVSDGGKRVTFHLRRDARWEDGSRVTSRDVIATYRAIMNPLNSIPSRYPYDQITSISAPDDATVVLRLRHPFSPMISFFFGGDSNYPVLQARALQATTTLNASALNGRPVASGPYRLLSWDRGDRMTLQANASYFRGRPAIARLAVPFIQDDATLINELRTGEVDAGFMLDASRIEQLRAIPNHRVVVTPVPYFYALTFNLGDPLTGDDRVRRAFSLALDRKSLVRIVTHGVYDATTGMRGLFTWAFNAGADTLPYDPRGAAALLKRAGWVPGADGIRSKNGQRLRIEIAFPTGSAIASRFATAIAAEERAIGIDVSLHQYDRTMLLAMDGPLMQGRYQVSLYDYQSAGDPDASWLLACSQRSPHGFNFARYCNAATDALLAHASATFDRRSRATDYAAIQRRVARDLPILFLCQVSEVDVIPDRLAGYDRPLLSPFTSVVSWRLR